MAHFAQIDENSIVLQVIVISNEELKDENNQEKESLGIAFCKSLYGLDTNWVQTSYNNTFRKQFASDGYFYDTNNDVFIKPKPLPSFILDENFEWKPPLDEPNDGKRYFWHEESLEWVEFIPETPRTDAEILAAGES